MLHVPLAPLLGGALFPALLFACALPTPGEGARAPHALRAPGVHMTPCRKVPVTIVGDGPVPPGWEALLDSVRAHGDSIDVCELPIVPETPRFAFREA